MQKLKGIQIFGIVLIVIGIATYFLVENNYIHFIAGVMFGIGVGLLFAWIPAKKRSLD